jgi:hypothetical protein
MNKNTLSLFKNFTESVLSSPRGIDSKAYNYLINMMKEDKDISMELHDVIDKVNYSNNSFFINHDDLDGYER